MKVAKVVPNVLSDDSIAYDVEVAFDNLTEHQAMMEMGIVISCDSAISADKVMKFLNKMSDDFAITSIELG